MFYTVGKTKIRPHIGMFKQQLCYFISNRGVNMALKVEKFGSKRSCYQKKV